MSSFRNFRNISSYDARGRQLRYVDAEEARQLCASESHEWRCVSCGKTKGEGPCLVATNHVMAVFEVEHETESDLKRKPAPESDTTLTFSDMKRNVGITEGFPGTPAQVGQVLQSRRRIRNWADGSIRNRAVTVVAREALTHEANIYRRELQARLLRTTGVKQILQLQGELERFNAQATASGL